MTGRKFSSDENLLFVQGTQKKHENRQINLLDENIKRKIHSTRVVVCASLANNLYTARLLFTICHSKGLDLSFSFVAAPSFCRSERQRVFVQRITTLPKKRNKEGAHSHTHPHKSGSILAKMLSRDMFVLIKNKHRKNCECCPGHYLSTSVY